VVLEVFISFYAKFLYSRRMVKGGVLDEV